LRRYSLPFPHRFASLNKIPNYEASPIKPVYVPSRPKGTVPVKTPLRCHSFFFYSSEMNPSHLFNVAGVISRNDLANESQNLSNQAEKESRGRGINKKGNYKKDPIKKSSLTTGSTLLQII
jgi:hypothetical protein